MAGRKTHLSSSWSRSLLRDNRPVFVLGHNPNPRRGAVWRAWRAEGRPTPESSPRYPYFSQEKVRDLGKRGDWPGEEWESRDWFSFCRK